MHKLGCCITTFNSNLTFTGNTSFHNNAQTAFHLYVNFAGEIWESASSLHFTELLETQQMTSMVLVQLMLNQHIIEF